MTKKAGPTQEAYAELQDAYDYFNQTLFGGRLPAALITFQRKNRTRGYFSGDRWQSHHGDLSDEIAMNPEHFETRSLPEVLSTLAHEMVHLRQHHEGKPSRSGYHNRQWADWMEDIGLIPSNTAAPGGKRTGQKMTHYIEAGGAFDLACKALVAKGFRLSWSDRGLGGGPTGKSGKSGTRIKYACPDCGVAVWGKADLRLACLGCDAELEPAG